MARVVLVPFRIGLSLVVHSNASVGTARPETIGLITDVVSRYNSPNNFLPSKSQETDLIRLFTCGRTGANTVLNTDSQAGWSRSCKWMVETMIC